MCMRVAQRNPVVPHPTPTNAMLVLLGRSSNLTASQMQVAVGWRTRTGSLVQRVGTRRLQVVSELPQMVKGVQPQAAAVLLARATVEEAWKAQNQADDPKRPELMQRIIGGLCLEACTAARMGHW